MDDKARGGANKRADKNSADSDDKLRRYIEFLFADAPPTKKAVELQEEMLRNLSDKYNDLLSSGKTEETAYNIAIAGIGDVKELIKELNKEMENDPNLNEARKRNAMHTAIAIMLYILSPLPLIIANLISPGAAAEVIGLALLFIFIAAGTGLLIYNNMTKPKYFKKSDTLVEEFKEWQSDSREKKALRKAISSALWCVILALYFVVSFGTGAWHITWIVFPIGGAVESLISALFAYKQ